MQNVKNFFLTNDNLTINRLQLPIKVGCTAEERAFPQIVYIDVSILLPLKQAALQDSLHMSLDYAEFINKIKTLIPKNEYQLIETIAYQIAKLALEHNSVQSVGVRVGKKVFTDVEEVSAYIWMDKNN